MAGLTEAMAARHGGGSYGPSRWTPSQNRRYQANRRKRFLADSQRKLKQQGTVYHLNYPDPGLYGPHGQMHPRRRYRA